MRNVPHYLRFVRALTFVSVALPVPVGVVAVHLAGCGGKVDEPWHGVAVGPEQPPTGSGGFQPGPSMGTAPSPCPSGCGISSAPEDASTGDAGATDDGAASADASTDATPDGSDDGGGPSRGTPELPASWLA